LIYYSIILVIFIYLLPCDSDMYVHYFDRPCVDFYKPLFNAVCEIVRKIQLRSQVGMKLLDCVDLQTV
jgi:hypothetical protein